MPIVSQRVPGCGGASNCTIPGPPFDTTNASVFYVTGNALTATPTSLSFNFSATSFSYIEFDGVGPNVLASLLNLHDAYPSTYCVLLPDENRSFEIPSGKGGMGQSNVCYPLAANGTPKRAPWIQQTLKFIDDYNASDILANPEADAEKESAATAEKALARSKGQGFARTPEERRALEDHSMMAAQKYFRREGFDVEDVSARHSYDLLCRRGSEELHVEVKGTTTNGDAIVLTNNEVKHVRSSNNLCALFILHSIRLKRRIVSGGKRRILQPWQLRQGHLTPITFMYRLH